MVKVTLLEFIVSQKNIEKFSLNIPVSRIIVNQPHSQSAGGSNDNHLNTTLSLGCGPWGATLLTIIFN